MEKLKLRVGDWVMTDRKNATYEAKKIEGNTVTLMGVTILPDFFGEMFTAPLNRLEQDQEETLKNPGRIVWRGAEADFVQQ
jgi:hypothetical protein